MQNRRTRTLLLFAPLTVLCAACTGASSTQGTTSSTSSATSSTSAAGAPTTRTTTTVTVTGPVQSTQSQTAGHQSSLSRGPSSRPRCSTANSTVTVQDSTPAGGSFFVLIHLTNTGTKKCRTGGYPGLAVLSDSGRQVFQAVRTKRGVGGGLSPSTDDPPIITLDPGEEATAVLEGSDRRPSSGTACPKYSAVLTTPPDTTDSVRLRATTYACRAPNIHPLLPGRTGSSS